MVRLLWTASAEVRYFLRRYMPSNIVLGPYPLWWTLVTNCPGRSEDGAWVRHVVVSRQSTRRRQ